MFGQILNTKATENYHVEGINLFKTQGNFSHIAGRINAIPRAPKLYYYGFPSYKISGFESLETLAKKM